MVLLPEGLKALKKVAKEVGLDLRGAYLNLDGGFDSARNRKCIFNAGMLPNIKENPRNELVARFPSPAAARHGYQGNQPWHTRAGPVRKRRGSLGRM